MACGELFSGDSELSSPCCWEPNRQPGVAIFTVFGGDPSVDILCKTNIVVNYYRCEMRHRINWSMVDYTEGSCDHQRNEGLLVSHSIVTNFWSFAIHL